MKKIIAATIVSCFLLTGCQENKYPSGIEHIVVIGIDGMSSFGLKAAHTPCMDSLMRNGAYSFTVRCILPSVSTPNWNAMLSGVGPEGTGAVDNSWIDGAMSFPYVAMNEECRFPNIFRIIREQKPDAEMGAIYQWNDFGNMFDKGLMNKSESYPTALETAQKTAAYIVDKKPDMTFVHLDDVDGVGHNAGHMSPAYLKSIEEADTYVRIIVDAIHEAGIAGKTLIMLTSDHGGLFYAHGGNAYEELNTPFIFSGKNVKKNYLIRQQIYRYDLAADIAFAFGLTPPQQWTGRPTKPAYIGFDEPENLWKSADVLPPPAFITKEINQNFMYGGLWVDAPATVDIRTQFETDGEIHYTTDRTEPTKESPLYTAPFTIEKSSWIQARVFGKHGASTKVSAQYRIADSRAGNGLDYAVYHCPDASFMPSFENRKPVATGTCYEFGFHTPENTEHSGLNTAVGQYKDHIGVIFNGWIQIDTDDAYTFTLWSTGGSKMFIGNELIVNNRGNGHSGNTGEIELKKGFYPIKIEIFHNDAAAGTILIASYEAQGIPKQIIPGSKLFKKIQ
ncbi:MAG: alkaline phosphatase family protein [Tannerellaceae bacterium]|jgi:hypothetical protein|nr:alkaline phosphatase family protein [Tannerellaceae bacterium]